MPLYMVRYGEIGIKSPKVRSRFERILRDNIEYAFLKSGGECIIESDWGHLYLRTGDAEAACRILSRTFGVTSFSEVGEVLSSDREALCQAMAAQAAGIPDGSSFAVRARRTGNHPYTSQELARDAGSSIYLAAERDGKKLVVDLTRPEFEFHLEVRNSRGYIYTEKVPGPGGLPASSQGRVAALVTDRNSAVAAWLAMKRGCRVIAVIPDDPAVGTLIEQLTAWEPRLKAFDTDEEGLAYTVGRLAGHDIRALFVGETLDGFKTLDMTDIPLPVFRPLIAWSEEEIVRQYRIITGDA